MLEAQLNTRAGSRLTVTHTEAPTIFPDATGAPVPNLLAAIIGPHSDGSPSIYADTPDQASPGHPTLEAVLSAFAQDGSPTAGMSFDDATIAFLDGRPGIDPCDQWVAAVASGDTPARSSAAVAARRWFDQLPR
jgi:hypothetical protein